jgi:hypothetical protein
MVTIHQRRKTDRERQMRWRRNKLTEGSKDLHIMLTSEAQRVLDQEKSRTRESYVQIINRAIIDLKDKTPKVSKSIRKKRDQKEVYDRIPKMDNMGNNRSQLTKRLKNEGLPTLSDKGKWFPRN